MAHRDYRLSDPTRVTAFSDRMEFHSPGSLPLGVSRDDLERASVPPIWRNQTLAWVFMRLDLAQGEGQGLRMMRELRTAKVPGFLGVRGSGPVTIMYWASGEALIAFAHDRTGTHMPAWADFNKRIRASGVVGIWHETFVVPGHGVESVYVDVAPPGLGANFPLVSAGGRGGAQRGRGGGAAS